MSSYLSVPGTGFREDPQPFCPIMAGNRRSFVDTSMAPIPGRSELISTANRWTPAPGPPPTQCREEDGSRSPVNEVHALTCEADISAALNKRSNARSARAAMSAPLTRGSY